MKKLIPFILAVSLFAGCLGRIGGAVRRTAAPAAGEE